MSRLGNILEITSQALPPPSTAAEARGQAPIRGFLNAFAGARQGQRQQLAGQQAAETRSLKLQLLRAQLSKAQQELNPQPLSGLEGIGGGGTGGITSQLIPTTQGVFAQTPQGLRKVDNQTLSFLERRNKEERSFQASTIAFNSVIGPLIQNNLLADTNDPEANMAAGRQLLNSVEFLSPGEANTLFRQIRSDRLAGRTLAEATGRFPEFAVRKAEAQVSLIGDDIKEAGRQLNRLNKTVFADIDPISASTLSFTAPTLTSQPIITITDQQLAALRSQPGGDFAANKLQDARDSFRREATIQQRIRRQKNNERLTVRDAGQPFRTVLEFDMFLNQHDPNNGVGAMMVEAIKDKGIPSDFESLEQALEGWAQCHQWDSFGPGYAERLAQNDPDLQHLVPDEAGGTDGSLVMPNGNTVTLDDLKTGAARLNISESELRKRLMEAGATEPEPAP